MYLEIDRLGNVIFDGRAYTEKEGLYSGTLSKNELERILSEINSIQLDSLKIWYAANWTDDQTCGVSIETMNKTYESSAYGFNKEPMELRMLFDRLMELHKNMELTKDSTISNKFKFRKLLNRGRSRRIPKLPLLKRKNETKGIRIDTILVE